MIYLIGGAPRVGKSIVAKALAEKVGADFVSTDDLEEQTKARLSSERQAELFPLPMFSGTPSENTLAPEERLGLMLVTARFLEPEIQRLVDDSVRHGRSLVIEGVDVSPRHASRLIEQYGEEIIRSVFVVSDDVTLILDGMAKNTNPNDWTKEADEAVRRQVAEFVAVCGRHFKMEAELNRQAYIERTSDFDENIQKAINLLRVPQI
jgi:hypothetical protein